MPNPFLAVTKLVSTVSEASAHLFVPRVKSALTPVPSIRSTITLYPLAEGSDSRHSHRQTEFVYGRVRWAAPRVIIEWQTKQGTHKNNFAIYRGSNMLWCEARLLDLSIFTTANHQSTIITYRAVDTTVRSSTLYYYWIVNLRAKDGEQRFGPYRVTTEEKSDS